MKMCPWTSSRSRTGGNIKSGIDGARANVCVFSHGPGPRPRPLHHTHTHTHFLSLSVFVCLRERRTAMEPSSPKKIQFDVPPLQEHLDPQAAEHIRRRRPTPATLQIYRQPEAGDQNNAGGGSQSVDGAQRRRSTLAPPTRKDLHAEAEQHPPGGPDYQLSPITAQLYASACSWTNQNGPKEANGNEAGLRANQERGLAQSRSSTDMSCESPKEVSSPDSVSR
ncbi:protein phosphatase 1 regulatory subunit 1A-like isoform X2 [Syngnathoides biaculeatus]|uniref:protein phosphatase 1 regulatory subunit 1A-like isoform X2 n=1 Tax=Syngnathoides biaculeatus TaxID=300417 RepID=UPI002ADE889C|nr:protein phosphatase 1 regulatory subunit 1A-like isoform X2 [Syngnathoides biaculeatus]